MLLTYLLGLFDVMLYALYIVAILDVLGIIYIIYNVIKKKVEFSKIFTLGTIILLQILTICLVVYVYLELSDGQYHFYMNTKTSLENIHNVKLDKYDGKIQRDLSTEEVLIRKQCQRQHLRNILIV